MEKRFEFQVSSFDKTGRGENRLRVENGYEGLSRNPKLETRNAFRI